MMILRLLAIVLTGTVGAVTLIIAVGVLLGVGWLAVAVPTLLVVALLSGAAIFWNRLRGAPGRPSRD
jgi:hypothetical protein